MNDSRNILVTTFSTVTYIVCSVVVVLIVTVGTQVAYAQETPVAQSDINIVAFPPRVGDDNSLLLKPGETRQIELRVRNSSPQNLSIRSVAQDFIIEDDGKTPVPLDVADTDNRWSLASWLTITPNGQSLPAGETKVITVLIEVPQDALPGGHYAMITHQPSTAPIGTDGAIEQNTGVNQRVGTLLYVIVDGRINEQAFIRDFKIPQFLEFGPVPLSFVIENESDMHIRPTIGVNVYNIFGKKIANIQPETKNIFPFTNRQFEDQWNRKWGFGRYTAEVMVTYGTQQQLAMARTAFWLIPLKLILTIVVTALIVLLSGFMIRRYRRKLKAAQSKKITELESKVHELEEETGE